MISRIRFRFALLPVDAIGPWGTDSPNLHWFGLTLGWFWIEVGNQELFRYSPAIQEYWAALHPESRRPILPYEDYQVSRYWEDLIDTLHSVLDPIPDDLAARVADEETWQEWQTKARQWQEQSEDEATWNTYHTAILWWANRTWDAGHLRHPPRFSLWRVGDAIHIRWNNKVIAIEGIPVWTATAGEIVVPLSEFITAVRSFDTEFLAAMAERVEAIHQQWNRPEIAIDIAGLDRDQQSRATLIENALTPSVHEMARGFSWEDTRKAIAIVDQKIT